MKSPHDDKTINKFDIDFVVSSFQGINLKFYFGELLTKASKADLRHLRQRAKRHKKHNRQHQAFLDVHNFSTHDAIISAINHELLKRSPCYFLYKLGLCLRVPIVKAFTGLELKEHEYFGTLYTQPKYLRHYYLHMSHKEFLLLIGRFVINNWKILLPTLIALLGVVATLIKALK